jgi:predicted dehydrogenase
MSRMKVAIVGAGWVTQHCYLPNLGPDSPLEVVRVYDPDQEKAGRVAAALGLSRPARDLAECLDASIRGVIICTPTHTHLPLLRQCLAVEKYVLCEKPVVCDGESVEALQAMPMAEQRLMGSATTRLRRDVELLLSWVQSGRIGLVQRMTLGWRRGRGVPASESWRTDPLTCPTGVLEDLGPHLLDIAAALLSSAVATRPERVESELECRYGTAGRVAQWYGNRGKTTAPAYEIPDYAWATIDFPGGPALEFEACWASEDEGDASRLVFEGTQGRASLQGLFGFSTSRQEPRQFCSLEVRGNSTEVVEFTAGPQEQQTAFGKSVEIFAQFCAGEAPPVAALQEVITVAYWLKAIRQNSLLSPVAGAMM